MLENVRFEPGETKNDPELAAAYGRLAEAYVDDAFGVAHRAHASNVGVVEHVAVSAAGELLQREVETIGGDPRRPAAAARRDRRRRQGDATRSACSTRSSTAPTRS